MERAISKDLQLNSIIEQFAQFLLFIKAIVLTVVQFVCNTVNSSKKATIKTVEKSTKIASPETLATVYIYIYILRY